MATAALLVSKPFKTLATWLKSPLKPQDKDAAFFQLASLEKELEANGNRYLPFLNVEKLKTGLYVLPAGAEDKQRPHADDEVYYIVSGKSMFLAGDEKTKAGPGSVLYVKAQVEHRFYDIEEDLKIIVFFSNMT